jgi:hypothetical protein
MKPEMGPPETKVYEFSGPDESWQLELTEFEKDIRMKREPDAGLKEAKASLRIVGEIYRKSGFNFDSSLPNA